MLRLYKSLVRPHLEFCISAWTPYYSKDKHLLERVQHRFTRMIPGLRHTRNDWNSSTCGHWKREETVPIYWKYLECTQDGQQLVSVACLH